MRGFSSRTRTGRTAGHFQFDVYIPAALKSKIDENAADYD
jgi:hypothetical protein